MNEESSALFDFGILAKDYDRWYDTPIGKKYDREEKSAVLKLLPPAKPGDRLLDVGCGTGHWSRFYASLGFEVVGVDISPEMIYAASLRNSSNCSFEIADISRLPFEDNSFEVVAAMAMLEFVSKVEAAVAEMFRCLKSNGSVIVGTLNKLAPVNRKRIAEAKEPYASGRLFSPAELRDLLSAFGKQPRVRISVEETGQNQIKPLRSVWEQFALPWKQPTGAFIVVEVRR
jgi:ubiquinone/menaquinone biosynthesis C-methylase UbiE